MTVALTDVLLVEDDPTTLENMTLALKLSGLHVIPASSGAEAVSNARSRHFRCVVLDLRLPDINGLDVARHVRSEMPRVPIVITSGFLTVQVMLQALKLKNVELLEKPIAHEDLIAVVMRLASEPPPILMPGVAEPSPPPRASQRSAIRRWAELVVQGCRSENDLKTLLAWATITGTSYSSLCEACRLVNVRPHEARDLVRALRAMLLAPRERCDPQFLLDVQDLRTLRVFLRRAGPSFTNRPDGLEAFLRDQRFVPSNHAGVHLVLEHLRRRII